MQRIIAIGDVHGCNNAFQKMLFEELQVTKEDAIYLVGDYIDRGPDSKGVIDTILSLQEKGFQMHTLRGNHEEMMMNSLIDKTLFARWEKNGGAETLESFHINSYSEMPEKYFQFFDDTKYYFDTGDYIFVHAGLNFNLENILEDREAMLWIRNYNPEQPALKNKLLVHGHTPKPLEYILTQKGNCINIDAGCVYTDEEGYGNLVAIILPQKEFVVVSNNA